MLRRFLASDRRTLYRRTERHGCFVTLASLIVLGIICGRVGKTQAQNLFQGTQSFELTEPAATHVVDDFNLDGWLDVAVTQEAAGATRVFLGASQKLFGVPVDYGVGLGPISVASGDLDSDGSPDLLVVNSGSDNVTTLLNRGDGSFEVSGATDVGTSPRLIELGDFNRDGWLDAVVTNLASSTMDVLLGNGRGSLRRVERVSVGDNPHSLALHDFDSDGLLDVAVAHREESNNHGFISRFHGRGDGTFHLAERSDLGFAVVPRIVAAEDFNRDGHPDLVTLTGDDTLLLLTNNGEARGFNVATVGASSGAKAGFFTGFLLVDDFDANGTIDIISPLQRFGNHGVRVHLGSGTGSFTPRDIFLDDEVASLSRHDVDRDGIVDTVATWRTLETLGVIPGLSNGRLATRTVVPLKQPPRALLVLAERDKSEHRFVALSATALLATSGSNDVNETHFQGRAFQEMVAGDFDGDGVDEIAVSDLSHGEVIIGNPLAVEEQWIAVPGSPLPSLIAAADFDSDAHSDLLIGDLASDQLVLVLRPLSERGIHEMGPKTRIAIGEPPISLAVGDADGDGAFDAAAAISSGISILRGDGNGGLERAHNLSALRAAASIALADLDGSGSDDLVAVQRTKVVVIYDPLADEPDPAATRELDFGTELNPLAVADVDGDGFLDVLAGGIDAVLIARGLERGFAAEIEKRPVGISPRSIAIGFFDGDDVVDAVTADFGSRSISVLHGIRGTSPGPLFRRGDADSGGKPDISDAVFVLNHLFRGGRAPACPDAADFNDDGIVNAADAIAILNFLFAGVDRPFSADLFRCGEDPTPDRLRICRDSTCF